jgi:adenosine deaminase
LLSNERHVLVDELGFNEKDLNDIDTTSVAAAFVEEATRKEFSLRLK